MKFSITSIFFSITAFLFLFGLVSPVEAQLTKEEQRKQLEGELVQIEKEIQEQNHLLSKKRGERQTVERDAAILNAEIRKAQLKIQERNLTIQGLSGEIGQKEQTIEELTEKIAREKASLAQLIRKRNEIDDYTMVEMVLGNKDLSEFFEDLDRFQEVKLQLRASMDLIREVQGVTQREKEALDIKRRAEADAKQEVEAQKRLTERKEAEKKQLAAVIRGEEQTYEQLIKEKERRAAEIRAALFALRDAGAIPFGVAYDFAKQASKSTGVRPALILAILEQESNMGQNVGTCNRPGDTLKWQDIMPGPGESWRDDQSAFLRITSKLGINPEGQPLSCPIGGGWGGAMGPSQFIPSTWEAYAGRIAAAVGVSYPNPWQPQHAITATALYMQDLGAAYGGWSAEREAACKYYSGRGCGLSAMNNTFYGDGVMARAQRIQETMIEPLESI